MTNRRRLFEGGPVFVIGFATLTAFFTGLGTYYLANPTGSIESLSRANQSLGGIPLTATDVAAWRYTAAVGMLTVGLMCLMVLVDLRRNHVVLVPAVFFKGFGILLWLHYYDAHPNVPVCLEFSAIDCLLIAAMLGLALPARARLLRADERPVNESNEPVDELVGVA
jgi:hypothetical protein